MNKKSKEIFDDDSIDLIELFSSLWKRNIFIIKTILIFALISVIYSLSIKNNFTATSIFYPHYQNNEISQGTGLQSLAGLAGINIGSQISDNIPPSLYPNIINSPEFKIDLLDSKINFKGNEFIYREYLLNKSENEFNLVNKLLLPINLISKLIFKNKVESENNDINILQLTEQEYGLHEKLNNLVFIEINDKEGFIKLSVKDNDAIIASQVAKTANELLQRNIIEFKLKNINDTYDFVSSQLDIAKQNFYNLQDSLAIFSDKNRNIKSDLFFNQYSRIESEYLISKNIYNELAINKEKTAIEVKKNTPIFTIIKPVVVPNKKSDPNRSLIVIVNSFLGLIIASFYVLLKPILFKVWKLINKK